MKPPRSLESVGAETRAIVAAGHYTAESGAHVDVRAAVDAAVASGRFWGEDELVAVVGGKPPAASTTARVRCIAERGGACVQQLLAGGARRVGILNYANGVKPGGGFLHGARAQEEALCRMSGLYACLTAPASRPFFDVNLAAKTALVTGALLTHVDVPFFRDEALDLLEAPFAATVISGAAPDCGWLLANIMDGSEDNARIGDVAGAFARRCHYVFAAAHAVGCDAIVVGPWGCGAFGNDPDVVASAFDAALQRWGDAFNEIVFSTWGPAENREAFDRRFKKNHVFSTG